MQGETVIREPCDVKVQRYTAVCILRGLGSGLGLGRLHEEVGRVHTSRSFTMARLMLGVIGLCRRSAMDVSPRPKSLGATASLPHGACAGAHHLCKRRGWHGN